MVVTTSSGGQNDPGGHEVQETLCHIAYIFRRTLQVHRKTRQSVAVQREEGIPVEKDTLAQDVPSDLVQIVNANDMIASVCEMLNGV